MIYFIIGLVCGVLIALYLEDILYRVRARLNQDKVSRSYEDIKRTIAENKKPDENEEYMKSLRDK